MSSNERKPVFCPYCGGEVREDFNHCPYCAKELPEKLVVGAPSKNTRAFNKTQVDNEGINSTAASSANEKDREEKDLDGNGSEEKKPRKSIAFLVGISAVAVCILVLVIIWSKGMNGQDIGSSTMTESKAEEKNNNTGGNEVAKTGDSEKKTPTPKPTRKPTPTPVPEKISLTVCTPPEDQNSDNGKPWLDMVLEGFAQKHPEWDVTYKLVACDYSKLVK